MNEYKKRGDFMQFYYGDQNYLRILDEMDFWKQQEYEHTTVIQEIVPNLDAATVNQLQEFGQVLNQTHQKAVQLIETVIRSLGQVNQVMNQHIMDFIRYGLEESQQFVQFLNGLLNSQAVKENMVATVVINHIIRESEYFIGISQTIIFKA
jgi:hypothetical protein